METLKSITAYYPEFGIGGEPTTIECQIRLVQSGSIKFVKTPFAMLDACDDEHPQRIVDMRNGFYPTREECDAYLSQTYPNWKMAEPIMTYLCDCRRREGSMMGNARVENLTGLNSLTDQLMNAARGHYTISAKTIKTAVKSIQNRGK